MKIFWLLLFVPALLTACPDIGISDDEKVRQAIHLSYAAVHYSIHALAFTGEPGLKGTEYDILYLAPDRYHVVFPNISAEVIVIGNKVWGYEKDTGWKTLGVPKPDPRELSHPIQPEDIVGFRATLYDAPNKCDQYMQGIGIQVCIDRASGLLTYLNLFSGANGIINSFDYKTAVSIKAPI